jgi:peptidoglycan hydrolase-like protein with peptidoglycan-binding domain
MSLMFSVAAPEGLRPDPDENSAPIVTLDPSDLVSVDKTLDPWTKVTLTKAGLPVSGWLISADLIPVQQATVRLFDEPVGNLLQTVTGRIDVLAKVATWAKVKVTPPDGSAPAVGWTEDAAAGPAPTPTEPGKSAGPPASDPGTPSAPAADDLVLGPNERYREALLQAQSITNIDAAALAALIDAEAAKIGSGADAGVWDPKSDNTSTSAAGLTQFLEGTWCDMACRPGKVLNKAARQKGMVTGANQIAPSMRAGLLALRFDPTMSIVTAAEYGLDNLNALIKDKLVETNLGDDDRAWHIYLAHHEGRAGAEHFLRNDEIIPFSKLLQQVGPARANQFVLAAGGDVTIAYRKWLTDFMEQKIQPSRFRMGKAPSGKVIAPITRALGKFQGPPIAFDTLAGEKPDLVLEMQQILSNLGYLDPPPDGFMGPTTRWAIDEFCKLNGLSTTGGFTTDIAAALLSPHKLLPEIRTSGQWIDRVIAYMQKKNYFICRHPDCKNIIYVEGVDADGSLNPQTPNVFEDLRVVFSIGADGAPLIQPWVATTEPGKPYTTKPMNPKGAARIALGQYKSWNVGTHVGPSGFDPHEALIQCAPIDIYRDSKKDFKREGPTFTGIFGVNQHWGYDRPKDDVGTASAGCLVGEKRDGHRAFMAVVKSDARFRANNGYKFVTAVIPGHEALTPVA